MNRRDAVFAAFALGAASLPFTSNAQQITKRWRVGTVFGASTQTAKPYADAFLGGMKDHGYVIGSNLIFDSRYADGDPARYPALVAEIIAFKPDVLIGANTAVAIEMKSRTTTIPIVLGTPGDPVGSGLVPSLARPGGNVTGVSVQLSELIPKQIELLGDLLPRMRRVALLLDASSASYSTLSDRYEREAKTMAAAKGLSIQTYRVDSLGGVREAFRLLAAQRPDALLVTPSPNLNEWRGEIARHAANLHLASIASHVEGYAQEGGLMSYGPSFLQTFRRVAYFVHRILNGAKPGDLPIEQPTKFSLVINGGTAKTLGIEIPYSILQRADQVIE